MEIITYILSAAKAVGVSGTLLLAICSHESGGFKYDYAPMDMGTPSYGFCQLKANTAFQLGFHNLPIALIDPKTNSKYSALYLKYQQSRYGDNWLMMTSAYNSGTYNPGKIPGCPKNIGYVKLVQQKLPVNLQNRLDCGASEEFAGNP